MTEADVIALRTAQMMGTPAPASLAPMLAKDPARPWNVLAITFTNKAADELKNRLAAMLGPTEGGDVNASTFHSACGFCGGTVSGWVIPRASPSTTRTTSSGP